MHKVIIVGGGPVGLSAALSLAHQGIGSVLIEKHPTTTNHPKARGVNCRSMVLVRPDGHVAWHSSPCREPLAPFHIATKVHKNYTQHSLSTLQ